MPLSHDVRLPKAHAAVFPNRCVVCGREKPGDFVRVTTHAIGWWTLVFMHFGRSFHVMVPACPPCAARHRRQKWTRLALLGVLAVPAVGAAVYLMGSYKGPFRKWLGVGIAVALLVPYFWWEGYHAPAVDLTAYSDDVDYEFADRGYAQEFAVLNGGRVD